VLPILGLVLAAVNVGAAVVVRAVVPVEIGIGGAAVAVQVAAEIVTVAVGATVIGGAVEIVIVAVGATETGVVAVTEAMAAVIGIVVGAADTKPTQNH
jgi:hypothetical protein